MPKNKNKGYVYLFVCTSEVVDGMYPAKFGCSKSNVKARLYCAQSRMKCKFDIHVVMSVKNAHKSECDIKWNWLDEFGQMYYMGSEFVGINPCNLDEAISSFKGILNV